MLAPVVLFVYNRPTHTRRTIEALARNTLAQHTELFIFSDAPRNEAASAAVREVREIIANISGFGSVRAVPRDIHFGLASSVISGVSEVIDTYGRIIVLEDDLVTSATFLEYMNSALVHYRDDAKAFSIGGYQFPARTMSIPRDYPWDTYASYRGCSWGWATWKDRWKRADWSMDYYEGFMASPQQQARFNRGGSDLTQLLSLQREGRIDSWAIRFCYTHFATNMHCIYPVKSLVNNIGLDNSGTHCGVDPRRQHDKLDEGWLPRVFCPGDHVDPAIMASFRSTFEPPKPSFLKVTVGRAIGLARVSYHRARHLFARVKNRVSPPKRSVDLLVVNTLQKNGGAARAAYRMFCAIRARYPAAHYLTLMKEDADPTVTGRTPASLQGALAQKFGRLDRLPLLLYPNRQHVTFSPAFWPNPLRIPLKRFQSKLVHLHWLGAGMIAVEELARLGCPVVWTLHDTWAFTGGCHYTRDCEGFKKQCGHCPQLGSRHEKDYSRFLMQRKHKAFGKLDLTIVAPSRWLADMARKSSLFAGRRIEVIPNGLDTERFKPIDRQAARHYLNITPDSPVVLFGAQWVTDPRKGGDLLCEALKRLDMPCTLLVFGAGELPLEKLPNITVTRLGSLADDISLAMVYSAADVFVCPSREDNLPNTVAEALACGTPCTAFGVYGLPEMIEHRKNGWLAQPYDTADFAEGIRWLVKHAQPDQLRRAAREKAVLEYNLSLMEDRYVALYNDLLKCEGKYVVGQFGKSYKMLSTRRRRFGVRPALRDALALFITDRWKETSARPPQLS